MHNIIRPSVLVFVGLLLRLAASVEDCVDNSIGSTLQDPEDCHGYFLCHSGHKLQQYCPPGYKYEREIQNCVVGKCPPCNCDSFPITTPSEPSPSTTEDSSTSESSTAASSSSSGSTESSTETSSLSTESSTETSSLSTESSTETSSLSTESSTDSTSTTSEDPTSTTSDPRLPVSCENIPDGSFFADLVHCRDYYVCRNREPVLLHCELGTWFDDINFVCNFRHLVNCPANID